MSTGKHHEYNVIKLFEKYGYIAMRSPASGGGTKKPRPDIFAGNGKNFYVVEVKSTKKDHIYIKKEQIKELKTFAFSFGAVPLVCAKFSRKPYTVFMLRQLQKTEKYYKINLNEIKKGHELEKFI